MSPLAPLATLLDKTFEKKQTIDETNNIQTLPMAGVSIMETHQKKVPLMCLKVLSIRYQISPEIRQDNQAW